MKVLITQGWEKQLVSKYDEYERMLTDRGFEVYLYPKRVNLTEEELIAALQDVDVFMCGLGKINNHVLDSCPKLRMISKFGVGLDSIDIQACTDHKVILTNCPGSATECVAEYTVALMLAAARGVVQNDRMVRSGNWGRTLGVSPYRKTLGIIGFGAIGKKVAQTVSGFNMRILAYTSHPKKEIAEEYGVEFVSLEVLLKESDFVTLHVPCNKETEGIINADALAMMKSTAILINAGRGALVDENALYEALKSNKIRAAALDVHWKEPIDKDDPLLTLDNCIMTSHTAASSMEGRNIMMEYCVQNILDIMDGKKPKGLINPEVFKDGEIHL